METCMVGLSRKWNNGSLIKYRFLVQNNRLFEQQRPGRSKHPKTKAPILKKVGPSASS